MQNTRVFFEGDDYDIWTDFTDEQQKFMIFQNSFIMILTDILVLKISLIFVRKF